MKRKYTKISWKDLDPKIPFFALSKNGYMKSKGVRLYYGDVYSTIIPINSKGLGSCYIEIPTKKTKRINSRVRKDVKMKKTINGKRYNTANCKILGERDHYSNGTYCGTSYLLLAPDNTILVHQSSNGQNLYFSSDLMLFDEYSNYSIDDFELTEEQEEICEKLGLIKIVK